MATFQDSDEKLRADLLARCDTDVNFRRLLFGTWKIQSSNTKTQENNTSDKPSPPQD